MVSNQIFVLLAGVIAGAGLAIAAPALRRAWLAFREYRGVRLITCPENREPAAVDVDLWRVAGEAMRGSTDVSLKHCSRWPERAGCAQDCLAQIQADPDGSRVQTVVEQWYAGKSCAYCGKAIHAEDSVERWLSHGPALLDRARVTTQWQALPPAELPSRMADSLAVCWSCHEAETFRREHPDLVTHRPPRRA